MVIQKSKKRKSVDPIKTYDEFVKKSVSLKKAVPGTLIEGEKNWVIGKYGRPLPIVYIPKVSGRKPIKFDPSKQCHCLKRIICDDDNVKISDLKWSLNAEKIFVCGKKRVLKSQNDGEKVVAKKKRKKIVL